MYLVQVMGNKEMKVPCHNHTVGIVINSN